MASATLCWRYRRVSPGHTSIHDFTVEVEFPAAEGCGPEEVRESLAAMIAASREAAAERVTEIDSALELIEGRTDGI